ncbi:MAG: FMN-binding protein [Clostridiales bacterium]|nr:FMN-binding protein [Clostridiales bacterium]
MNKTLKSVVVLTVIAVVCAGLLTVANYFWKAEEPQGVTAEMLAIFREMIDDDSAEFYELEISGLGLHENINNIYKASAGQNKDIIIIRATGIAGSYGIVQMLTAINTNNDTIISTEVYLNETDREEGLKDLDAFKGLDNQTLQNTQFDVISQSTITGNAMSDAVKLAMAQYVSDKQEILDAPAKSYDLLTVNIFLEKDIEDLEAGESVKVLIEIISSNTRKANPKKASVDITITRNGDKMSTPRPEISYKDNKAIYTLTLSRIRANSYEINVKATIKKITAEGSLRFDVKDKLELEVIKRMFEGTTEVTLVEEDTETGAVLYKNNLGNDIYAYTGYGYEYGDSNIFISFDEEGKIEKIDGKVTNSISFDLAEYLQNFVRLDASELALYEKKEDLDFGAVSGATVTSEAINETVSIICQYYQSRLGE